MISLLNEDCVNALRTLADGSIDVIINDPPYGTTQCGWDIALDLDVVFPEFLRVLKPDGAIVMFSAQPFTSKLVMSRPDLFRCMWYWEKERGTNFLNVTRQPLRVIEEICVFAPTSRYVYNPQMIELEKPYRHTMPKRRSAITGAMASEAQEEGAREYKTYTHRHPTNILRFPRDNGGRSLVPTQKPLALMDYLVRTYSNPGDVVLDPTMGSGTTGVACVRAGRSFIGIEKDERHFAIARDRVEGSTPGL